MRKVLFFDIETLPILSEVFKKLPRIDDWHGNSMKATINSVLCIGYKWQHENTVKIIKAWDKPNWNKSVNDDSKVLKEFAAVMSEADAIVTQNGKKFDVPFLQTRMLLNNLPPLPKVAHVDTKQIAKRHLFSLGNRLDDLAEIAGSEKKVSHEGWLLWEKAYNKDPKALKIMEKYCKQDVQVLVNVFAKLLPFVTELPNANMYDANKNACPNCGSLNLIKNGVRANKESIKQRYVCNNCGSNCQETIKGNRV